MINNIYSDTDFVKKYKKLRIDYNCSIEQTKNILKSKLIVTADIDKVLQMKSIKEEIEKIEKILKIKEILDE